MSGMAAQGGADEPDATADATDCKKEIESRVEHPSAPVFRLTWVSLTASWLTWRTTCAALHPQPDGARAILLYPSAALRGQLCLAHQACKTIPAFVSMPPRQGSHPLTDQKRSCHEQGT